MNVCLNTCIYVYKYISHMCTCTCVSSMDIFTSVGLMCSYATTIN